MAPLNGSAAARFRQLAVRLQLRVAAPPPLVAEILPRLGIPDDPSAEHNSARIAAENTHRFQLRGERLQLPKCGLQQPGQGVVGVRLAAGREQGAGKRRLVHQQQHFQPHTASREGARLDRLVGPSVVHEQLEERQLGHEGVGVGISGG